MALLFVTKTNNYLFLVSITSEQTEGSSKVNHRIKIYPLPNRVDDEIPTIDTQKCLHITIETRKLRTTVAHIHLLRFDGRCSLRSRDDMGLHRGEGTYEMVMSTLCLCKELFGVSKFTLEDASKFKCEPNEDTVQLLYHNLLVHGKTYYERRFGATLRYEENAPEWNRIKSDLRRLVPVGFSDKVGEHLDVVVHEEYIDPCMSVIKRCEGRCTINEMFAEINKLPKSCVYFKNESLSMMLTFLEINITTFIDFMINISDVNIETHLLKYEQIGM